MNIIYEDNDIIVVEKPINVPVQRDKTQDLDMVSRLQYYLRKKNGQDKECYIGLVHRLDRPVSGIMVFGKTPKATANLNEQIRQGKMKKVYEAEVVGSLPKQGYLENWLLKDAKNNVSKVVNKETGAKLAKLEYTVIETYEVENKIISKVQINLLTGRHHQIRVQFAYNKNPLVGDTKYNPELANFRGYTELKLHAIEIEFNHPILNKIMKFSLLDQ